MNFHPLLQILLFVIVAALLWIGFDLWFGPFSERVRRTVAIVVGLVVVLWAFSYFFGVSLPRG